MHILTGELGGTDEMLEGIVDNLLNEGTHPLEQTTQWKNDEL